MKGEVEIDDARIFKQVQQSALGLDIDGLLVSQNQALVNHFQCIVRLCGVVAGLDNLGIAAISKSTDKLEIAQRVCGPTVRTVSSEQDF